MIKSNKQSIKKNIQVNRMNMKEELEQLLFEAEKIAQLFNIEPFDMYLLGGSACLLGDYNQRVTMDFDFVDLNYSSKLGKVFTHLRDFDLLEYESSILSPTYKSRAKKLDKFKYLNIYILSMEDIIVSKIIRLEPKDIEDINTLLERSSKELINHIIEEVLNRSDLYKTKKDGFREKLVLFKELYNV